MAPVLVLGQVADLLALTLKALAGSRLQLLPTVIIDP